MILFARNTYDNNNKKIIDIINTLKNEYTFDYKLHPSLNAVEYEQILSKVGCRKAENLTISELLNKKQYLCTITYNSTAYYDSYINNCISLRYIDENADDSILVMEDAFRNKHELKQLLSLIPGYAGSTSYWKNVSEKLTFILGFNMNKYKDLLGRESE